MEWKDRGDDKQTQILIDRLIGRLMTVQTYWKKKNLTDQQNAKQTDRQEHEPSPPIPSAHTPPEPHMHGVHDAP